MEPGREVPIALLPQEWDLVMQALAQLPFFQVVNLINKVASGIKEASKEAPKQED